MRRPSAAIPYEPRDLKLGIKSSLPRVKSTLALLYLVWEVSDYPSTIEYGVESGDSLLIKHELEESLYQKATQLGITVQRDTFSSLINENYLLKSQLESLIVAFELVWKVGMIQFSTQMGSGAERTGHKRYAKTVRFSTNMDLLKTIIRDDAEYKKVLYSWLGINVAIDHNAEKNLIQAFTIFAEDAIYKLEDSGNSVIFNLESVYRTLLKYQEQVDVNGDVESKGPLRILKSALSENFIASLVSANNRVRAADDPHFSAYYERVVTQHKLITAIPGETVHTEDLVERASDYDTQEEAPQVADNILLYGVPGAGKSHTIKTYYCNDPAYMERIVFHPDYSYSDFIGQILPETDGAHISYPFIPGPFTRILKRAVTDPGHMYYLVIEEINRGNAPAIFGEIFQLLDRENGESEYGINNADIALEVYGDRTHEIKIPSNLFVLATMNTADQNVFTLDTAFKRRWSMKSIENDLDNCQFADSRICGTDITWGNFARTINDKIIELGENNISSEDNRLGAYFVRPEELHDTSAFAEKVLMYLWNDAFKYEHDKVFKRQYHTLEELIRGFQSVKFDVFVDTIVFPRIEALPADESPTSTDNAQAVSEQ